MTPEATIKARIRAFLVDEMKAYYFAPVQTGMGVSTLDILCCIQGRFVGIEVKTPGKKPTAHDVSDTESKLAEIKSVMNTVKNCIEIEDFPKRPNPLCGWCDVMDCEFNRKGRT